MGMPMASGPGFLKVTRFSYVYSYGASPMGIPMTSGLGRGFSAKLLVIPMGIPMASGLGRGFSFKLPAIPMGIPMGLFLWVFLWLVA